jgi:hypothetical protein
VNEDAGRPRFWLAVSTTSALDILAAKTHGYPGDAVTEEMKSLAAAVHSGFQSLLERLPEAVAIGCMQTEAPRSRLSDTP